MSPKCRFVSVGKRTENAFRRTDAIRALKAAHDGGLNVSMIEIVTADGTTFRVYGDNVVQTETTTADAKAWTEEIAKLKATPKDKGKGQ
jgi:hypothetical protein